MRRDDSRSGQQSDSRRGDGQKSRSFDSLLESAVRETCPEECYTVTYTADSRLRTYSYRTREYTF